MKYDVMDKTKLLTNKRLTSNDIINYPNALRKKTQRKHLEDKKDKMFLVASIYTPLLKQKEGQGEAKTQTQNKQSELVLFI